MDYNKLKESIKSLITDSTTTEQVEQIGGIIKDIEVAENEFNTLADSKKELNKKYVDIIKNNSFKGATETSENKQPRTFDEIVKQTIQERKKQ